MARPKKQEVDYFPHYCDHGKVLFVIEDRWGNDGYAAFYRLMELLGKTNSHCYDCHEPENWEYLIATIRVSEDMATDILNKLSSMHVIDPALWKERRIWMQSFVDSIADVYARRKVDLPTKPCTATEFMPTETPPNGINDDSNPQSKVKERKVKESKDDPFDSFWKAYPKKVGKKEAQRAWQKASDLPSIEIVLKAIEVQKSSDAWKKDNGQFIPNPATWLNQGRWEDELRREPDSSGGSRIPEYKGEHAELSPEERAKNVERIRQLAGAIGAGIVPGEV